MTSSDTATLNQVISLPGVVYGLGDESSEASQWYATRTGRAYKSCTDIQELPASSNDVVICTSRHLTASLMHKLYVASDSEGAPGLIAAATTQTLMDICRRTADRFVRPRSTFPKRVFLYPTLDFTSIEQGTDLVVGGSQPIDDLLPVLSAGAPLLTVFPHSDGVDFNFTLRQFACPFYDLPPATNELLPPCQELGHCIRMPSLPTIAEARANGWLVPLKVVSAEVTILFGCNVIRLEDGQIDPGHGLASALLAQADIGALITTWRNEFGVGDGSQLHGLMNDLCAGLEIGAAVQAFNSSKVAVDLGIKLGVMGDPCFSLVPNESFTQLPLPEISTAGDFDDPNPAERSNGAEIKLLREAISTAALTAYQFETKKANALLELLKSYLTPSGSVTQADISHTCAALVEFVSAFPLLDKFFLPFAKVGDMSEEACCRSCGAPARSYSIIFPEYGAGPRQVITCARCYDSSNLPAAWQTSLDLRSIDERKVAIKNVNSTAKIKVCLTTFWGDLYKAYDWTCFDGEWPAFQLPDKLPPIPLYCQVLIVDNFEIGSAGFKLKRNSWQGSHTIPFNFGERN